MNAAYVYALVVDGTVRYIGKGTGDRAKQHVWVANGINRRRDLGQKVRATKFYNRLAKALRDGAGVEVVVIAEGLSHEEAFEREIAEIGRAGDIWNSTLGGEGFTSEVVKAMWTDEFRAMMSEKSKQKWAGDAGRRRRQSEWAKRVNERLWAEGSDFRALQSARVKAELEDPKARQRLIDMAKGMWTEEFRAKRSRETSDQMLRKWKSQDARSRQGKLSVDRWSDPAFKAKNRGAIHAALATDEQRARVREQSRQRWADPEFKARVSRAISEGRRRRAQAELPAP